MHMLLAPVAAKQVNHGGREEARTSLYSVAHSHKPEDSEYSETTRVRHRT